MTWMARAREIATLPRLKAFHTTSYAVFDYLSKIALVCGILFSAYQFSTYKADARIRYTFQFIEKFDAQHMLNARAAIEQALEQQKPAIAELNRARVSAQASTALRRRIASFLINDSNGGKGLAREVEALVDFFDALHICLRERLCDRDSAKAFLGSHALMVWKNFEPYIRTRRDIIPRYGRGLEAFATAN